MTGKKKVVLGILGVLVLLGVVIAIMLPRWLQSASIEGWIAKDLSDIANRYITPELGFTRLTYHYPKTVVLENLTLTSPDPRNAGKPTHILAVKKATLELAEIPRVGKPIIIEKFIMESPEIRLIATEEKGAQFVGFSNFLKANAKQEALGQPQAKATLTPAPGTAPAAAPSPVASAGGTAGNRPLSSFLQIRVIDIKDGLILYDPRLPGTEAFKLDQINTRLDINPESGSVYALNTTITRKPVFDFSIKGKVDIDTFTLQTDKLTLALDLKPENRSYLPPQIQQIMNTYEVTGQLAIGANGTLPVSKYEQAKLAATVDLNKANVSYGQYKLPVDSLHIDAGVANQLISLHKLEAKLLGGTITASGTSPMDPAQPARLQVTVRDVQIEKSLRTLTPGKEPPYAGIINADVLVAAPLAKWDTQAAGNGTVTLRNGHISKVPVIGEILTEIAAVAKIANLGKVNLNDAADVKFTFAGNKTHIDSLNAKTVVLALRGNGDIYFDNRLDMHLNGGPLEGAEKMVGGDLGKILGKVSDSVAGYHVTGTTKAPKVALEFGGKK